MKLSNIIAFSVGTVIGSLTGYTIAEKRLNKKCAESIEIARQHYQAKLNSGLKKEILNDISDEEEYNGECGPVVVVNPEDIKKNTEIIKNNDYTKYSKEKNMDEINIKKEPYQVSEDEYNDSSNYNMIELTYFVEDDTVMDSTEMQINDGNARIGRTNIDDIIKNELDEIFVKNDDYGEVYHVTVDPGSYNEYMNGFNG